MQGTLACMESALPRLHAEAVASRCASAYLSLYHYSKRRHTNRNATQSDTVQCYERRKQLVDGCSTNTAITYLGLGHRLPSHVAADLLGKQI